MTGMKMFKLWIVVMLLGLLPFVSEAQEEINNAINVQLEYLKKYPKDKEALRKVSFLYLNKADYDQAIFYGRQLFELGYNERDYNGAVIYSHICLGQAHMMKGNVKEAYSHLGQARLIGESNKNDSALCSVYNGLGLYASNVQKDYYRSLTYFFKGVEAARRCHYDRLYSSHIFCHSNHCHVLHHVYLLIFIISSNYKILFNFVYATGKFENIKYLILYMIPTFPL